MRVMQAMGTRGPGGAETFFVRLVGAMRGRVEQRCLVRRNSWLAGRLDALSVEHDEIAFGGMLDPTTRFVANRKARAFRPDVVMTWMARATDNAPLVGAPVIARLGGYYKLKRFRRANWLVCNTQDIVDYCVREGWPENRVRYIPNFADGAPPADPAAARAEKRAALAIGDDAPLALAAGRLHVCKGFDLAIRALGKLDQPLHLAIAGVGDQKESLERLARDVGVAERVHFLGWVNDLAPWIAAADIWCAPSREEPLGNIVLDAWLHEKPILASDVVGPAALIDHGETGLLCALDPDAVARGLDRLLREPEAAAAMARAGHRTHDARFAKEKVVGAYLDLFDEVRLA